VSQAHGTNIDQGKKIKWSTGGCVKEVQATVSAPAAQHPPQDKMGSWIILHAQYVLLLQATGRAIQSQGRKELRSGQLQGIRITEQRSLWTKRNVVRSVCWRKKQGARATSKNKKCSSFTINSSLLMGATHYQTADYSYSQRDSPAHLALQ
jgi:hypothetical protein